MKIAYFIERLSNTAIIKKISDEQVDIKNVYIEEQANSQYEAKAAISALRQDDTLILRDIKELNPQDPQKLKICLKALQEIGVEIVSLEQPELSGLKCYDGLKEFLAIDGHYKRVLKL